MWCSAFLNFILLHTKHKIEVKYKTVYPQEIGTCYERKKIKITKSLRKYQIKEAAEIFEIESTRHQLHTAKASERIANNMQKHIAYFV